MDSAGGLVMADRHKRPPRVIGYVDGHRRCLTSIRVVGNDDPLLVMVDTGFTGCLAVSPLQAEQLKVIPSGTGEEVGIADGKVTASTGTLFIEWFGSRVETEVHIFQEQRSRRFSDPIPLLGARLLLDHKLLVDYPKRTLTIR